VAYSEAVGPRELAAKLERLEGLDGVSDTLAGVVNSALGASKSLLSGTWFGHPLHATLTDVPIGCWTGAVALDLAGGRRSSGAVGPLVAMGALAALPTALTGLNDWADTYGPERRVGLVHALANSAALGLFGLSLISPRRGRTLRLLGLGAVVAGGYLGGHLSFAQGVGVDHQLFREPPEGWVDVAAADDLAEASSVAVAAGGARVMLHRRGSQIYAISAICPHAAGPLDEGGVDDELCVTCPWHGSRFRLSDGQAVRGPATGPALLYEARVRDGRVEVRAAGPA
jgi:nitrite reductase/ring-hydroxylating ferredoxin subunit